MEKELKCDIKKLSPKEQEELRKKIIRQMKKQGVAKEVAEICECSVRHVYSTRKKYKEGGISAITAVKMGRPKGKCCKLKPEQEEAIKKIIIEKTPEESGLIGYLWYRAEICELVRQQYGIEIAVRTMGEYLRRWNFTPQRPQKKITAKTQKQ